MNAYSFISPSYVVAENKYNKQKLNERNKKYTNETHQQNM